MSQTQTPVAVCTDPDCGCQTPAFTEPMEAIEFLAGRMRFAGVSTGVALAYANDLDAILARQAEAKELEAHTTLPKVSVPETLMARLQSMEEDCFNLRYDRQVALKLELLEALRDALLNKTA